MSSERYAAYAGAEPYFELIRTALGDLVDGDHFFDVAAEDIAYEVRYELGWPRVIRGRTDLMAAFRGYVGAIRIRSVDELVVNRADRGRVVIVEYDVHGTILATGANYDNRFLLDHRARRPEDLTLARLYGLACGVDRIERVTLYEQ